MAPEVHLQRQTDADFPGGEGQAGGQAEVGSIGTCDQSGRAWGHQGPHLAGCCSEGGRARLEPLSLSLSLPGWPGAPDCLGLQVPPGAQPPIPELKLPWDHGPAATPMAGAQIHHP